MRRASYRLSGVADAVPCVWLAWTSYHGVPSAIVETASGRVTVVDAEQITFKDLAVVSALAPTFSPDCEPHH